MATASRAAIWPPAVTRFGSKHFSHRASSRIASAPIAGANRLGLLRSGTLREQIACRSFRRTFGRRDWPMKVSVAGFAGASRGHRFRWTRRPRGGGADPGLRGACAAVARIPGPGPARLRIRRWVPGGPSAIRTRGADEENVRAGRNDLVLSGRPRMRRQRCMIFLHSESSPQVVGPSSRSTPKHGGRFAVRFGDDERDDMDLRNLFFDNLLWKLPKRTQSR